MELDDINLDVDAAVTSASTMSSSSFITPPNTASAMQTSFGSISASNLQDDVESSPERRQAEYHNMCNTILARVALQESEQRRDDDNNDYGSLRLEATLAKLFKLINHSKPSAKYLDFDLACLLDQDSHPFLHVARQQLEATHHNLPASILNQLMDPVRPDRSGSRPPPRMNPVQPRPIILERIRRHLSGNNRQPQNGVERLDLFLRSALAPERYINPDATESIRIVRSAFTTAFQGPAVDRLLFHLAVLSAHAFTTLAPPHTNSSAKRITDKHHAESGYARLPWLPYYARVIPILQSSGFGKTKLCVHLSARQPGLLTCLRHHRPHQATSFPPQDRAVFNYFKATLDLATHTATHVLSNQRQPNQNQPLADEVDPDHRIHARLACFLAAYCHTLHLHLKNLMQLSGCFTFDSRSNSVQTPPAHHTNPLHCWQTVVYALSVCIHQKSSFLERLRLTPPHRPCSIAWDKLVSYGLLEQPSVSLAQPASSSSSSSSSSATRPSLPLDIPDELARFLAHLQGDATRDGFLNQVIDRAEPLLATAIGCPDVPTMAKTVIQPPLVQLEHLVGAKGGFESAIFYLALDECGTIEDLLPHLRRLWNYAEPQRTWIFLIDTNSKIAPVAGHTAIEASYRTNAYTGSFQLTPAFTSMPLDVHFNSDDSRNLADSLSDDTCTLRDLNCIMYKLGRPLWNDVQLYRHHNGLPKCHGIIAKLVKGDHKWRWPDKLPQDITEVNASHDDFQNVMALVSQRVPLGQYSTSITQTWQTFVRNQVSSHLRFVERIHPYTDAIQSHVPSEPPLSVAAAWSFRYDDTRIATKWSVAIVTFVAARTAIGLSIGLEGEEGVQLLCSMAADFAASARYKDVYWKVALNDTWSSSESDNDIYLATVGLITLDEWLTTLLGGVNIVADRDSETDEATLKAWSQRQWINFKHVGDLPWQSDVAKESMDRGLLAQFWIRHAAMRGVSNQSGWDLLIPIYESVDVPAWDRFQLSRLSYVAIQVKNSVRAPDYPKVLGPDLSAMDGGGQAHADTIGCLELFLDLRGPLATAHSLVSSSKMVSNTLKQTRHNIYVSGLDEECYPVLNRLHPYARDVVPVVFGLSYLGTNRFDQDFARMVHEGGKEQQEQARRQLDVDAGKFPLIAGIPMQKQPSSDIRQRARGFANGQSKRMRRHDPR